MFGKEAGSEGMFVEWCCPGRLLASAQSSQFWTQHDRPYSVILGVYGADTPEYLLELPSPAMA